MDHGLKPGLTGEVRIEATPETFASAWGNTGIDVLATLYILAAFEQAAGGAVLPYLEPGQATVGTHLEMDHFAPTPEGMTAVVRATLQEVRGARLSFAVEVTDDLEVVAKGVHVRYIVERDRFVERINDKRRRFTAAGLGRKD
jgi:fluoroacetyl-CoA thioesterase